MPHRAAQPSSPARRRREWRRREERKPSTNLRGRHHWARASRRRSLPCAAFSAAACSFVAQAAARGGPRSRTFRAINRARSYLVEICAGPRGIAAFEYASTSSPTAAATVPHPSTRQYRTRQRHLLSVGLHRQRRRAGDAHEAHTLERRRLEVAPWARPVVATAVIRSVARRHLHLRARRRRPRPSASARACAFQASATERTATYLDPSQMNQMSTAHR